MCAVRDDLFSHVVPLKLNVRPVCMWSKFARFILCSFDDTVVCVSSGCHIPHLSIEELDNFPCLRVCALTIGVEVIRKTSGLEQVGCDLISLVFVIKVPVNDVCVYIHFVSFWLGGYLLLYCTFVYVALYFHRPSSLQ